MSAIHPMDAWWEELRSVEHGDARAWISTSFPKVDVHDGGMDFRSWGPEQVILARAVLGLDRRYIENLGILDDVEEADVDLSSPQENWDLSLNQVLHGAKRSRSKRRKTLWSLSMITDSHTYWLTRISAERFDSRTALINYSGDYDHPFAIPLGVVPSVGSVRCAALLLSSLGDGCACPEEHGWWTHLGAGNTGGRESLGLWAELHAVGLSPADAYRILLAWEQRGTPDRLIAPDGEVIGYSEPDMTVGFEDVAELLSYGSRR